MIFGQNRDELRKMYADAWQKRLNELPMSPLESQIAGVIAEHPEYHEIFSEGYQQREWRPEDGQSNPFLHMGLHLAIREQVATDRPTGIRAEHQRLCLNAGDAHDAEHRMIEALAESLWEAQRNNAPPDETLYLERLRRL